jgi:hypothetical protein
MVQGRGLGQAAILCYDGIEKTVDDTQGQEFVDG